MNIISKQANWTRLDFIANVYVEPIQDDLERCNCSEAGSAFGHIHCGICRAHNLPMFMCRVCSNAFVKLYPVIL